MSGKSAPKRTLDQALGTRGAGGENSIALILKRASASRSRRVGGGSEGHGTFWGTPDMEAKFLATLGVTAAAWPLAARAQTNVRRIGVLMGLVAGDPEAQSRLRTQSARHRVDHGTICGRSCANSGHCKPLCACVDRTKFVAPASGRARIFSKNRLVGRRLFPNSFRSPLILQMTS
jgi:hypothetical protein